MAGILDEVMDGIAAKEKPGQTPSAPPAQGQEPAAGEKPMHSYSDQFKGKYGERK
jgi:hypothetical protein